MSSLRLALKQSLEESAPQQERKRKNGKERRLHRNKQRERARSIRGRGDDNTNNSGEDNMDRDNDERNEFSSENEFDFEDDDEDEESGDEEGSEEKQTKADENDENEHEQHLAAHTIQSRWKDSKKKHHDSEEGEDEEEEEEGEEEKTAPPSISVATAPTTAAIVPSSISPKSLRKNSERGAKSESSTGKAKTVPPPTPEVIEWMQHMPVKRSRRNVAPGLRVKVRFATKVKREGKIIRKKKWYGGRVSAVSKEGSKIRIKYDDGTSEVTRFPDKDVVVDDAGNGQHQAPAQKFLAPATQDSQERNAIHHARHREEEDDEEEKDETNSESHHRSQSSANFTKVTTKLNSETNTSEQNEHTSNQVSAKPETHPTNVTEDHRNESTSEQNVDRTHQQEDLAPKHKKETDLPSNTDAFKHSVQEKGSLSNDLPKPKRKRGRPPKHRPPGSLLSPKRLPSKEKNQVDGQQMNESHTEDAEYSDSQAHETTTKDHKTTSAGLMASSSTESDRLPTIPQLAIGAKKMEANNASESMTPAGTSVKPQTTTNTDSVRDCSENRADLSGVKPASEMACSVAEEKSASRPSITIRLSKGTRDKAGDTEQEQSEKQSNTQVGDSKDYGSKKDSSLIASHGSHAGPPLRKIGKVIDDDSNSDDENPSLDKQSSKRLHIHIPVVKLTMEEKAALKQQAKEHSHGKEHSSPASKKRIREKDFSGIGAPRVEEQGPPRMKKQKRKRHSDDRVESEKKRTTEFGEQAEVSRSPTNLHSVSDADPQKADRELAQFADHDADASCDDGASSVHDGAKADSTKGSTTPRTRPRKESGGPAVRSGRRAAQEANERIASKKEDSALELSAKKKKKRDRQKGGDGDDSESSEDDSQWVQCDKCKKWRIIPTIVVSTLPTQWFCDNNQWDPKRASCDAPEQTAKQAAKERKRRKKLQRRLRLEAAAAADSTTHEKEKVEPEKPRTSDRARSPILKESQDNLNKAKRSSPVEVAADDGVANTAQPKSEKKLFVKKQRSVEPPAPENVPVSVEIEGKRGRGRPRRNPQVVRESGKPSGAPTTSGNTDEADNLEWVQCEKCNKWRKLPAHISADELPETWYCSMNYWAPASASCDAPEDKADGLQDIGFHAGIGGCKLSYRSLIFGQTGRKAHRPISERTRAAESIFGTQHEDEDAPPTVTYANSSNFIPRGRSSLIADETPSVSIFDLMASSHLFADLRRAAAQSTCSSTMEGVPLISPNPNHFTYETIPANVKRSFRDLLLHSIGDDTVNVDQLLSVMLADTGEDEPEGWAKARAFCSINTIVTTIYELVKEGLVDCIHKMSPDDPFDSLSLRYRRSRRLRNADNISLADSAEARERSRCMKIAKPWKR